MEDRPIVRDVTEREVKIQEERYLLDANVGSKARFVIVGGNLALSWAIRNDSNCVIRTLFVVKDEPGEHKGDSRDAHPRLTLLLT